MLVWPSGVAFPTLCLNFWSYLLCPGCGFLSFPGFPSFPSWRATQGDPLNHLVLVIVL